MEESCETQHKRRGNGEMRRWEKGRHKEERGGPREYESKASKGK